MHQHRSIRTTRSWIVVSLLIASLLLLSACIANPTPAAQETPAPTAESQETAVAEETTVVEDGHDYEHGIVAEASADVDPAFDIVHAVVERDGDTLIFRQVVSGEAGSVIPTASGALAGAKVESYVWPTSLDSASVGFEAEQGILSLVITSHPDFDDTPLWDEDEDGDAGNDGRLWHSHWVVLVEDTECGPAALKVRDIPEGETPAVPVTWPELPLLIDSPNFPLALEGPAITVSVPQQAITGVETFTYDGVAAGLQINANVHSPLLCVTGVYDIASGDLSLPGEIVDTE